MSINLLWMPPWTLVIPSACLSASLAVRTPVFAERFVVLGDLVPAVLVGGQHRLHLLARSIWRRVGLVGSRNRVVFVDFVRLG